MEFKPTEAQQRIYDFIENGKGNGIIDAVAGAGKTSTLMGCVSHIPNIDDVIYCAFNTSIRKELQKKFKKEKRNVKVCTIHSLGFLMLRATRDYEVKDYKYRDIIKDTEFLNTLAPEIDKILGFHNHPTVNELKHLDEIRDILDWEDKNALNEGQQYVGKIVNRILDINQKYRCTLEDDRVECYDKLVRHFSIFQDFEFEATHYKEELTCYFHAHQKVLKEGNSMAISHGIIDYTDMLYLPKVLKLTTKNKYGFVFVDECQDLSRAQLYVVRQYLKEDGRLLAVGDPFQSIYGFAGADNESFERIRNEFNCTRLGLTDCFRCPQDVIKIAKSIRPDINGFKQYPGKIYNIPQREVIFNIKQGDLVICRSRGPLMSMAIRLISKDFKVKIHPDELEEFMGDYKNNFTSHELRRILTEDMIDSFFETARERNEKRIIKNNNTADSIIRKMLIKEQVKDMENALLFLKKKYFDWHLNNLENILKRLKYTLSYPGDDAIKISSIHRAKGLENDRVFILEYNKLPHKAKLEWEQIQERNLHYVAVTRPKEELYLCDDQLYTDGEDEAIENVLPAEPMNAAAVDSLVTGNVQPSHDDVIPIEIAEELISNDKNAIEQESKLSLAPITTESETYQDENSLPTFNALHFSMSSIKFHPIKAITKIPSKFYSFGDIEDTPYPMLNNRASQKAKYWSVLNNLQDTEFSIYNIVSAQYQDQYYIDTPEGIEVYVGWYKDSGQYDFKPQGNCKNAEQLMIYLTDESNYTIKFEYHPEYDDFDAIHQIIQASCQELGICNTNIYSEQYSIIYCFRTHCSYAYIKVMYNGKKVITQIMPHSTLGEQDDKLNVLLNTLHSVWQA